MQTDMNSPPIAAACVLTVVMATCASLGASAHDDESQGAPAAQSAAAAPASSDPRAVAEAFIGALATGDEAAVRALLLPDVLIYESGGAETSAAEYAGHHMPADIAFLANLKREQLSQASGGDDTTAWVATRSRFTGRFKDKDVDLNSTETLVMTRTEAGWRIAHIHWSSAPHRSPDP